MFAITFIEAISSALLDYIYVSLMVYAFWLTLIPVQCITSLYDFAGPSTLVNKTLVFLHSFALKRQEKSASENVC